MSRRIVGPKGQAAAKTNSVELERRAVDIPQDAWHGLTSWFVVTYSDVVVEDLDIAAMKRSMERRAFCRSLSDAPFGIFAPMGRLQGLRIRSEHPQSKLVVR